MTDAIDALDGQRIDPVDYGDQHAGQVTDHDEHEDTDQPASAAAPKKKVNKMILLVPVAFLLVVGVTAVRSIMTKPPQPEQGVQFQHNGTEMAQAQQNPARTTSAPPPASSDDGSQGNYGAPAPSAQAAPVATTRMQAAPGSDIQGAPAVPTQANGGAPVFMPPQNAPANGSGQPAPAGVSSGMQQGTPQGPAIALKPAQNLWQQPGPVVLGQVVSPTGAAMPAGPVNFAGAASNNQNQNKAAIDVLDQQITNANVTLQSLQAQVARLKAERARLAGESTSGHQHGKSAHKARTENIADQGADEAVHVKSHSRKQARAKAVADVDAEAAPDTPRRHTSAGRGSHVRSDYVLYTLLDGRAWVYSVAERATVTVTVGSVLPDGSTVKALNDEKFEVATSAGVIIDDSRAKSVK